MEAEAVRAYGLKGMTTTIFMSLDSKTELPWTGLLTTNKTRQPVEDLLATLGGSKGQPISRRELQPRTG